MKMNYQLQTGQMVRLAVRAADRFSTDTLQVIAGEQYDFSCVGPQRWTDLFRSYGPEGYHNGLASLTGLRVPDVNCFCLCGGYPVDEGTDFAIGSKRSWPAPRSGQVAFFANDVSW